MAKTRERREKLARAKTKQTADNRIHEYSKRDTWKHVLCELCPLPYR